MHNTNIIGIDIGLKGGISTYFIDFKPPIKMPIRKVLVKKEITILDLDSNNKKQFYKTGPNKGLEKRKIKTPAKYKEELDLEEIHRFLTAYSKAIVVIELPGNTIGNSAKATASTYRRYGELLGAIILSGNIPHPVTSSKWKKDLNLSHDKNLCVKEAEKLSNLSFLTNRGSLLDGPAEALLIQYWGINFITKQK